MRVRLDQLVVERGLAPSRQRARALILAGQVSVDGRPQTKAGTPIERSSEVALIAPDHPYVGRGGVKLAHALDTFHISVEGREALDKQGVEIDPGTPDALAGQIRGDIGKWRDVIAKAGIKPE